MKLTINSNFYDVIVTASGLVCLGNTTGILALLSTTSFLKNITKQSPTQLAPVINEVELNNHFPKSISVTYSLALQIMGLVGLLNTLR
jgi:hypothetical protein